MDAQASFEAWKEAKKDPLKKKTKEQKQKELEKKEEEDEKLLNKVHARKVWWFNISMYKIKMTMI